MALMKPLHLISAIVIGVSVSVGLFLVTGPEPGDARLIVPRVAVAFEEPDTTTIQQPADSTGKTPMKDQVVQNISRSAYDITPYSAEKVKELASTLDEETYRITQKAGTEPPFCGTLLDNKKDGVYACVVCGLPLFSSEHKFTSGTGWPSYDRAFDEQHIKRIVDRSHGMVRTEIECARCGAHLGHIFDDGPKPTGERHCLNSASLTFLEKGKELPPMSQPIKTETAYFAAGCFWGAEHYFQMGPGVINASSGYMQGRTEKPTYKDICSTDTGHAETVKVVFDPTKISYKRLVEAFFAMHDPTQLNRQGPDVGSQYRSGIWVVNGTQRQQAQEVIEIIKQSGAFKKPIVTQVEQAKVFWPAEDYHQDYIATTGRACHVTNPWSRQELAPVLVSP